MQKFFCEKIKGLREYLYMNVDNVEEIEGMHLVIPDWLRVDVSNSESIIEEIKDAIDGKEGEHYFWGNMYYASFEKEYSVIKSTFYDEGDERLCKLPTKLLLSIVEEWLKELKIYRQKMGY